MSDTTENSVKGTIRAFVASSFILLISLLWYLVIAKKLYTKYVKYPTINFKTAFGLILAIGFVASAISVQLPKTMKESIVFGMLVGLVIYGCTALILMSIFNWGWDIVIAHTLFGMVSTSLASLVLWFVFFK